MAIAAAPMSATGSVCSRRIARRRETIFGDNEEDVGPATAARGLRRTTAAIGRAVVGFVLLRVGAIAAIGACKKTSKTVATRSDSDLRAPLQRLRCVELPDRC